jgi:hypothetical protein
MTTFDDRERGFEAAYAHDEELTFRLHSRRDRLVGEWAAAKLGLSGDAARDYAQSIVREDLKHAGDEDVIAKLLADLAAHGVDRAAVLAALGTAEQQARDELEA